MLCALLISLATITLHVNAQAATCQTPTAQCLRGSGNDVLKIFDAGTPQAASPDACCAACQLHKGCVASMVISKDQKPNECWLEQTQDYKQPNPSEVCMSSLIASPAPPERFNRTSFSGVWVQHGSTSDLFNRSYLVGGDLPVKWSDIEVSDGVFDWNNTDAGFYASAAAGLYIETALMTGDAVPNWIFNRTLGPSVPMVKLVTTKTRNNFPYYLDPAYPPLFLRAVKALADHIASLPPGVRKFVSASQAMFGSTGDDTPWHGVPVDPKYDISRDTWHNFTLSLSRQVCQFYTAHNIPVLWNPGDDCIGCINNLYAICPGSFAKNGMASHSLQYNYEMDDYLTIHGPICHLPNTHCRGEDWPYPTIGAFLEAPAWAQYWHLLELLYFGLDMPGLSEDQLTPEWTFMYDIFNHYAGSVRPPVSKWVGGIIALRDGLDSANTDRFPEATFGTAVVTNQARLLAIAAAFKDHGAHEGDPASGAATTPMDSRTPKSMNDVGWRIFESNFGNGAITQIDANTTSVGWWRVGNTKDPYGRFARGFESASGKTAMSFTLDTGLWGGLPLPASPGLSLVLRVVYYDMYNAGFNVAYDAGAGCKNVSSVTTGTSGGWKNVTINVNDGHFARRCGDAGADIALFSTTKADAIIHSIEIFKP